MTMKIREFIAVRRKNVNFYTNEYSSEFMPMITRKEKRMSDRLQANIRLINDGIKFSSSSGDNPEIISDYYPPLGNNEGYKPLELFLISFGTCVSGTILPLLRRMNKTIRSYILTIEGIRKTEHPTGFSTILLTMRLQSPDTSEEELQKILTLAKQKFCPVWSMIKQNVLVRSEVQIEL